MGLFSHLGRSAAPAFIKGKWLWKSLAGSEEERVESEHAMGATLAREYRATAQLSDDTETIQRIKRLGDRLCKCLSNPDRRFAFDCVQAIEPNAFALPGGFIFVSRALADLCQSDDELASVLAHEVGHVVMGHAIDGLLAAKVGGMLSGGHVSRKALGPLLDMLLSELLSKNYSRTQEFEADRFALRLMDAAGMNGRGMASLFERLDALRDGEDSPLGPYFTSHPPLRERIATAQRIFTTQ